MHILFLTDNFYPESNAPANRTFEHCHEWINNGHKVTVITCAPNFPEGKLHKGYKNKIFSKENISGIDVWRVKTYITPNEGFWRRIIDFISFMISSAFFGIFSRNVDIVIGTSPQFFTVISAWMLAKIKGVPFIFELRDLWPTSIVAVGIMNNNKIIVLLEKIELFLYSQANLIISLTQDFKNNLISRGIPDTKIKVISNGADLKKYNPQHLKDKKLSLKYELNNKFVVGFIGTHGMAHSMDVIVKTADLIKNNKNIQFIFVGAGSERARIKKIVNNHKLFNITMIPRQPSKNMPIIWSLCDVSLVTLKDTPLFAPMIPSKIFESMAMSLPMILATPDGAATKLIRKTKSGFIVPPEDPRALSLAILKLHKNKNLYDSFAVNSLQAAKMFDRKKLALKMLNYIEELKKI